MVKSLDKDIVEVEVFIVIKYMKNNKFFGRDGYIVKLFFLKIWNILFLE